jgi:hypothetical protein
MSLNSLSYSQVTRELGARRTHRAASDDAVSDATGGTKDTQNALSALVEYMPTETVALYLATLAALPAARGEGMKLDATHVYWLFAFATPLFFVLIYAGKRRAAGLTLLPPPREWPWWPTTAATLAFLAWGLAVPDAGYFDDENRALAGVVAIGASAVLGVVGRLFARPG